MIVGIIRHPLTIIGIAEGIQVENGNENGIGQGIENGIETETENETLWTGKGREDGIKTAIVGGATIGNAGNEVPHEKEVGLGEKTIDGWGEIGHEQNRRELGFQDLQSPHLVELVSPIFTFN